MRPQELHRERPVARGKGQVRAGLRYVWATPALLVPLVMMGVVSTLGYNFSVLLPLLARFSFHRGGGTYGAMTTAMGIGALAGSLLAAAVARPSRRLLVAATLAFGLSTILVAASPQLVPTLVLLVPMGAAAIIFVSTTNSLLQVNATAAMRGRVMALWGVVFFGSTPLGGPLAGLLAGWFGPRVALAIGGIATLATGVAAWYVLRRRRVALVAAVAPAVVVPSSGSDSPDRV
jgi:MFS family permease